MSVVAPSRSDLPLDRYLETYLPAVAGEQGVDDVRPFLNEFYAE